MDPVWRNRHEKNFNNPSCKRFESYLSLGPSRLSLGCFYFIMKAFIDDSFWSDPMVEELDSGEKLAILWLLTNSKRDLCGFTEISHKRFTFDTGLEVAVLQRALQGLSKGFVVPSKGFIWSRNFIAHQLGRGVKLQRNNITKSVVKHLVTLPIEFQELLLSEYPELEELTKGLPSPYQGERKGKGKGKGKVPKKKASPKFSEDALEIYKAYPLKKAKPKALESITKALKLTTKEHILSVIPKYIADCQATQTSFAYPATWFNAHRWEDEYSEPKPARRVSCL